MLNTQKVMQIFPTQHVDYHQYEEHAQHLDYSVPLSNIYSFEMILFNTILREMLPGSMCLLYIY